MAETHSLNISETRNKKPSWDEKLPLVRDAASAMSYLHNLTPSVTHKDLKMENVVVNANENSIIVKVCNSGFSNTIEKNSTGTFEHFPPENLKDPHFPKQEAFDVYGFAILMWRVMTPNQKMPYSEATGTCSRKSVFELVLNDDARPSLELVPSDVSRKYIDLMKQCWSTAEKDRPGFTEIVDRLEIEMKSVSHTNNENNNKSREPDKNR